MITADQMHAFQQYLLEEERSCATMEKYLRDIRQFSAWADHSPISKGTVAQWKEHLLAQCYSPSTINAKLTALDRFLSFSGLEACRVKHLRVQRQLFREDRRELSKQEYHRLLDAAAAAGKERLALLMETICATGIRVSELRYITVQAVQNGKAQIALKGKIRTILLPGKLCRKLSKYAGKNKIASDEIFLTRGGKPLSRKQIWAEMKALCRAAGVDDSKVFPHNLRHLFARVFYQICHDVVKLADTLGHSSIETTRIYLISTGTEHIRTLEQLRLVS